MDQQDQIANREKGLTREIALKILRYLDDNPHAADTVEGILHWWLLERVIVEEKEAVERALDCLVEKQLLVAVQAADSRRHYRLNRKRIRAVRKLISEAGKR